MGCYIDGKPRYYNGDTCAGIEGGNTEQCCMIVGRCTGNTDGDQDAQCPGPTGLKEDKVRFIICLPMCSVRRVMDPWVLM